jgi:hypothetical protein
MLVWCSGLSFLVLLFHGQFRQTDEWNFNWEHKFAMLLAVKMYVDLSVKQISTSFHCLKSFLKLWSPVFCMRLASKTEMGLWHRCCVFLITFEYEYEGYVTEGCSDIFSYNTAAVQTGPGAHPASCTMGAGFLSRGWSCQGVALTTHCHIVLRLMKE